ncbi:hypothetical protein ACMFMF_011645 [Clarireedia jacksonii]
MPSTHAETSSEFQPYARPNKQYIHDSKQHQDATGTKSYYTINRKGEDGSKGSPGRGDGPKPVQPKPPK